MHHAFHASLALLTVVLPFGGTILSAQVSGTVVDSVSNKPLAGATVHVANAVQSKATTKDGRFRLDSVGVGAVVVVRRAGYVPKGITPAEPGGDVGSVLLRPVKTDQDRQAVDVGNQRVFPQLAEFYRRRRDLPAGFFFTPDDVELSGAREPSDLVRRAQGFRNVCVLDRQGATDCGDPTKRGTTYTGFRQSGVCTAAIWVDGALARAALDEIIIADVLAIEAYAQPGSTPVEMAGSRCGTIMVWRKH